MSSFLTVPFLSVKFRFNGTTVLSHPLDDLKALRIGEPLAIMAGKYAEQFQQTIINKGEFLKLLPLTNSPDYYQNTTEVYFSAAKDGFSYPDFSLHFDYYWKKLDEGFFAVIPVLGMEIIEKEFTELENRLAEAIQLVFAKEDRLLAVESIAATIWFDQMELIRQDLKFKIPTLTELAQLSESSATEKWLPKVAEPLKIRKQEVWHRESEMEQLSRAVKNTFNRNVILVGTSGVGKSALVRELAHQLSRRKIVGTIWQTNASTLVKELTTDMGWEENLGALCRELSESEDILFIQNLLELFEVGQYEGSEVSMANVMRSYISRGTLSVISECTEEELAKIELRASNFVNLFQIIRLEEPTKHLEEIIINKVQSIANEHHVKLSLSAIRETIRLNRRFTPYSGMPGRPIRFLESLILNFKSSDEQDDTINNKAVIRNFCEETGLPLFMVDPEIPLDLEKVKTDFNAQIAGQELATQNVVNLLGSVKTALTKRGKPIASFLFVGPTGVGKTEMAKVLSQFMFGSRERMIRFDMSEYSHPQAVSRLIGTSYFTDGLLTSAVRREPFSILLFDEIEKADADFYDLLLQVLDEGRLTDSQGKVVNFCSTIIIMTSNIGAANLQDNRISWTNTVNTQEVAAHFESAITKYFRPEFINRIDRMIPFQPLSQPVIAKIVKREIDILKKREGIRYRNVDLFIDPPVFDYLGVRGYDGKYGARYLQRTIREELMLPLSRALNKYEYEDQLVVKVDLKPMKDGEYHRPKNQIKVSVEASEMAMDLLLEELEKINQADHASYLRSRLTNIEGGPFYVKILSAIDILEAEKKRKKQAFWKDAQKTIAYKAYLDTITSLKALKAQIHQLELSFSLAKMSLEEYRPEWSEELKQWEKDFLQLKLDIYSRSHPASQKAQLAIFGKQLAPIVEFYQTIFENGQFEREAQGIWFRESYYQELIPNEGDVSSFSLPREAYLTEPLDLTNFPTVKPPAPGDVLYGIIFSIKGPGAYLFLKEEGGFHHFYPTLEEELKYFVQIVNDEITTPKGIHRTNFYGKKARRTVRPEQLVDTEMKINREVAKLTHADYIFEILENRFKVALDAQLS